ncbi:Isoquinoline 1-oxidoreductase alpha subunit [hydrothermal vent metagenome]|uniref:Isoquinoline 1-oxidoreductase alpha subunit n=1 Tax=hydrothermal vent metagenome TaxID=652676 RepID=A0A3B0XSH9_9ZZZZ
MIKLTINNVEHTLDADSDMPLLWAIRDIINLTGTKFGCGISQCGACTVHIDGVATRSCVTPISAVENKHITTIEGVTSKPAKAIQDAWQELEVAQCGYCQSGQIMQAIDLLSNNAQPNDDDINAAMSGNICRCNTYARIRAAIHLAAKSLA